MRDKKPVKLTTDQLFELSKQITATPCGNEIASNDWREQTPIAWARNRYGQEFYLYVHPEYKFDV